MNEKEFNPQSMDAKVWAKEFMRCKSGVPPQDVKKPCVFVDEEDMLGWFANAIMAGYDEATRKALQQHESLEKENKQLRACHEAELGVCQEHCEVISGMEKQHERLVECLEDIVTDDLCQRHTEMAQQLLAEIKEEK